MEKVLRHKSKRYSKLSSTVFSGARESSLQSLPFLHPRPNFLPIGEAPPPSEVTRPPGVSLVSKLCASLRQFHERCAMGLGLPCIDRFISPSRSKSHRRDELVRYRRPKSRRQIQLAQNPQKISPLLPPPPPPHPQKASYLQPPMSILQKEDGKVKVGLVGAGRAEFARIHGRTRPRRMYTPDGKVIHYVIPCHSDSSFTDHPKKTHKMTQVNSESLIKIQVSPPSSVHEVTTIKSEGQLEPTKLTEDGIPPGELRRPSSSPQLKRVTFSENLVQEFNGNLSKGTTTSGMVGPDLGTRKSKIPKLKTDISVLTLENSSKKEAVPEVVETQVNFDDHFYTTTNSLLPPRRRRRTSSSVTGRINPKPESNLPPVDPHPGIPANPKVKSPPEVPDLKPRPTNQGRKAQFENPAPPFPRPKSYSRVSQSWFPSAVDRESWDRQKSLRPSVETLSKQELRKELHLKYGRFPKVLEMKKQKFGEEVNCCGSLTSSPRTPKSSLRPSIANSFSSSSFSTTGTTAGHDEGSGFNPRMRSSYPTVIGAPEIKFKRLRTRLGPEESRVYRGGEPVRKGHLANRSLLSRSPLMTRRLREALESDTWPLADGLLLRNTIGPGNDEVKKGRPSTAV